MKKVLLITIMFAFATFIVDAQQTTVTPVVTPAVTPDKESGINAPEIIFENTVHDYGTIANGADGSCEFKFKNTGKEPLIISACQTSCGCTIPQCPKEPILPGKSGVIKVTYATTRTGKINKTITVTSNAKIPSIVLSITGDVLPPVKEVTPEKTINNGATPVNPQN